MWRTNTLMKPVIMVKHQFSVENQFNEEVKFHPAERFFLVHLQAGETSTALSQWRAFPQELNMTQCLPVRHTGFAAPLQPKPFMQNRAVWLHTAKQNVTRAHLNYSFQPIVKQGMKRGIFQFLHLPVSPSRSHADPGGKLMFADHRAWTLQNRCMR